MIRLAHGLGSIWGFFSHHLIARVVIQTNARRVSLLISSAFSRSVRQTGAICPPQWRCGSTPRRIAEWPTGHSLADYALSVDANAWRWSQRSAGGRPCRHYRSGQAVRDRLASRVWQRPPVGAGLKVPYNLPDAPSAARLGPRQGEPLAPSNEISTFLKFDVKLGPNDICNARPALP